QARDPGFGAKVPEGKWYDGPRPLHFEGYGSDRQGRPTFRYRIAPRDGPSLAVEETPGPRRSVAGVGVRRRFKLETSAPQDLWMLAGEAEATPRVVDDQGAPVDLDWRGEKVETPAAGRMLLLPQSGGKVVALVAVDAPKKSNW